MRRMYEARLECINEFVAPGDNFQSITNFETKNKSIREVFDPIKPRWTRLLLGGHKLHPNSRPKPPMPIEPVDGWNEGLLHPVVVLRFFCR